jgi:hypothetical protein
MLPILLFADQLAYVFAAGAVAALADLLIYKGVERAWQRRI